MARRLRLIPPRSALAAGGAIVALIATVMMRCPAYAASGFNLTVLATIPGPAPGGGQFTNDFEPWDINNRGELSFCADLTTGGEGVFTGAAKGPLSKIIRPLDPAPGGGTFSAGCWADSGINDGGDVAVAFQLDPFTLPFGSTRVYHSPIRAMRLLPSHPRRHPGAPTGTFGRNLHAMLNNRGDGSPGLAPMPTSRPGHRETMAPVWGWLPRRMASFPMSPDLAIRTR